MMNKLTARNVRSILDGAADIKTLTDAMLKEIRPPTGGELIPASLAVERIIDLVLSATVVEVEVDPAAPRRNKDRAAPAEAQRPAPAEPEATDSGSPPPLPMADPVPAKPAAPIPEAAEVMTPPTSGVAESDWLFGEEPAGTIATTAETMEQLAVNMVGEINRMASAADCDAWLTRAGVKSNLLDLSTNAPERHTQVLAALYSKRLLSLIKACKTQADAVALSREVASIEQVRWLKDHAPLVHKNTTAEMDAHVKGLPK